MQRRGKKNVGVVLHTDAAEFRVWAPFAAAVSIVGTMTPHGPIGLESENDGYWYVKIKGAEAGQNYQYHIETAAGEIVYKNDPRARIISASDDGFGVIADNSFEWGDDQFSAPPPEKQIMYELHLGTFNRPDASTPGNFHEATKKLDYLAELGVNMIELMPITSMAYSGGWGYAPNYIYAVESAYGGRHGLMKFVKACHERGIGVILDIVLNHFSAKTDLWQFDGWNENGRGGIYFYNDYRGDTPWGGRPDYGRPEVRQFILDSITMWLSEYHLDGLRVDSTIYMRNTEGHDNDQEHDIGDAWTLLAAVNDRARKVKPSITMIAEDCANNAFITKSTSDGGCGFNSQWELGFPHGLRDALGLTYGAPRSLSGIRYELTKNYNGNAFEKIIFSDSHDTAANGSVRINTAASPSDPGSLSARQKLLVANAVTLTAPGIPMLLQGQEFMQEGNFNDWQALDWEKSERFGGIVLAHRHLIDLRLNKYGTTAGLSGQHTSVFHQDDNNAVMGYHRWSWGGPKDDVIVIVNFSSEHFSDYRITLPVAGTWKVRFNSTWKGYSPDFRELLLDQLDCEENGTASLELLPYMVLILSQD